MMSPPLWSNTFAKVSINILSVLSTFEGLNLYHLIVNVLLKLRDCRRASWLWLNFGTEDSDAILGNADAGVFIFGAHDVMRVI